MPTAQPDPRRVFNYYADVQEEYNGYVFKLLRRTAADVSAAAYELSGPDKNFSSNIRSQQLTAVKKVLHEETAKLYRELGYVVQAGKEEAAAAAIRGYGLYEEMLLRSSIPPGAIQAHIASMESTARSSVEAVLKRVQGKSYYPLSMQIYDTQSLTQGIVDRAVEKALTQGMSAREFAKTVRNLYDPTVPGGASYASMRLARTEINNAFHAVSMDKYESSPWVLGVEWHLSTSHPEGDECDDLAGGGPLGPSTVNPAYAADVPEGMWPKDQVPDKPHPQCFCYITPVLMGEDDFLDAFFERDSFEPDQTSIAEFESSRTSATPGSEYLVDRNDPNDPAYEKRKEVMAAADREINRIAMSTGNTPEFVRNHLSSVMQDIVNEGTVSIRVRDRDLSSILRDGLMPKHLVEASGLRSPVTTGLYDEVRRVVESLSFKKEPVYGFIRHPGFRSLVDGYGDVEIRLKPSVWDFTSIVFGDSMDDGGLASPIRAIDHYAITPENYKLLWGYDYLSNKLSDGTPVAPPRPTLSGIFMDTYSDDIFLDTSGTGVLPYIEAQIHKTVTKDMIEEIVFTDLVPGGVMKFLLREAGIPWRLAKVGERI